MTDSASFYFSRNATLQNAADKEPLSAVIAYVMKDCKFRNSFIVESTKRQACLNARRNDFII